MTPLNNDEIASLVQQLAKEKVKSVAIALLFSYINHKHENEIGKILKKSLSKVYVSLSSDIAPEYMEYERTSTAVVNAVLMPIISSYLNDLQRKTRNLGVKAPLCIMQSDGGIAVKRSFQECL